MILKERVSLTFAKSILGNAKTPRENNQMLKKLGDLHCDYWPLLPITVHNLKLWGSPIVLGKMTLNITFFLNTQDTTVSRVRLHILMLFNLCDNCIKEVIISILPTREWKWSRNRPICHPASFTSALAWMDAGCQETYLRS